MHSIVAICSVSNYVVSTGVRNSAIDLTAADDAQITSKALDMGEAGNDAPEAPEDKPNTTQDGHQGEGAGKKRRKPKKKAKHLPLLPSVLAVEDLLAWKLEQTARLGRHAIAKQSIAAGTESSHLGCACSLLQATDIIVLCRHRQGS